MADKSRLGPPSACLCASSSRRRGIGLTLLQATGSAEHVDEVLRRFQGAGLKGWSAVQARFPNADERALYEAIGVPYLPPELREGRGELDLASQGTLPPLLEPRSMQGVFHVHTDYRHRNVRRRVVWAAEGTAMNRGLSPIT